MLPELINSKLIDLHGQEGHSTRNSLEHLVSLVAEVFEACLCHPFIPLSRQDLTAASWETVILIPLYPRAEARCITRLVKAVANPSLDNSWTQVKNFIMKTFFSLELMEDITAAKIVNLQSDGYHWSVRDRVKAFVEAKSL